MKLSQDLNTVEQSGEFTKLAPGGYIARIVNVTDVPEKEYLKIEFDIAEGEFKGYYARLFERKGFWAGNFIKSYKESALPFFKGFITSVEKSNSDFKWNQTDETLLRNKQIGVIIGEDEYIGNDGNIKLVVKVRDIRSVDVIRNGNFIVPEKKHIQNNIIKIKTPQDNSDCPF